MDPRELQGDLREAIRVMVNRYVGQVWTALPVIVHKWNYASTGKNTVHLISGVMGRQENPNGTYTSVPMPIFPDVPVHYPGGGGMVFTHPISEGDEGMCIFSSRCLDSWWQHGGQQPPPDYGYGRRHSLSDGMFIPGMNSVPQTPENISTTASQIRSKDGSTFFELGPNGRFNMTAPGGFFINGLQITPDGNIITRKGINSNTHVHGGVTPGGAHTNPPS